MVCLCQFLQHTSDCFFQRFQTNLKIRTATTSHTAVVILLFNCTFKAHTIPQQPHFTFPFKGDGFSSFLYAFLFLHTLIAFCASLKISSVTSPSWCPSIFMYSDSSFLFVSHGLTVDNFRPMKVPI